MRIAIDARCLMARPYSGVGWYAANMIAALAASDPAGDYRLLARDIYVSNLPPLSQKNISITTYRWPNNLLNLAELLTRRPNLDRLAGGVDALWLPNINFAAWSPDVRTVLTIHDISFVLFPEFFSTKMRWWHAAAQVRRLVERSAHIVADSESTKRDIVDYFRRPPGDVTVIYPGINQAQLSAPVSPDTVLHVRQKYQLPERFFLYMGTIEPRKNIESICEAYRYMTIETPTVVAGSPGWKSRQLMREIRAHARIHHIGYIDEVDKATLYQLATGLVYPSYYEGFGLPLAEAMAAGCPVIAGANSSQIEVVGTAGILVDPRSVGDVAQAMRLLETDADLRAQLRLAGRDRAARFRWDVAADRLRQVLYTTTI